MSKQKHTHDVLICGAGLGGLAAAIALAKRGMNVRIIEKSAELGEVGAGIQLSPNAMHVLNALGLQGQVEAASFEPEASVIRDYATGRALVEVPLKNICASRYGAPYFHIHRADLHRILESAARDLGVSIALGQTATGITQTDTHVHLETQKEAHSGDVLIGADGVRSQVRDGLLGAAPPEFTGQVAWRGVVPKEALPDGLISPDATVWVGPQHHFVTYYVRSGRLINFVAVQERSDWINTGWSEQGDITELRDAFKGWHPQITALLEATKECYLWALLERAPLPSWSDGRITLMGDAAHPMLPFMAQGAAMALEDAWVLADTLADHKPQEALQRYAQIRKPRATMVQAMSQSNAKLFHRQNSIFDLWPRAKLKVGGLIPQAAYLQLDKIYGVNVTEASR